MDEYIKKEKILKLLEHPKSADPLIGSVLLAVRKAVENLPADDAEPVRHGRWISFLDGDHIMPERYYKCSRCGRVEYRQEPYCHCGAKMDGGADDGAES